MKSRAAAAERNRQVREAAAAWHRAGVIDAQHLATVEAAYPDDRGRLGPVFRTLVGGFTAFGVFVALGLATLVLRLDSETVFGALCLAFGLGLLILTEFQMGPLRRAQSGAETATGLLTILLMGLGFILLLMEVTSSTGLRVILVLAWCFLVSAFAAIRWGSVSAGVVTAVCFFLLLAQPPGGRALWATFGAVLPPLLLWASDSARLGPSHRKGLVAGTLVCLLALYVALHIGSWDEGLVGWLSAWNWSEEWLPDRRPALRGIAIAGTALLPVLTLAAGVLSRRRAVILAGGIMAIASLVTLRTYVHLMPLSFALMLVGGLALVAALVVRRLLDCSPAKERFGFTAEPLFDDPERMRLLEAAAGMVTLTPAVRPTETPGGFEGGGGHSGGGGATESF